MASFKLFDMAAKECGKISLNSNVFNEEYKPSVIHEVVVAQEANLRQGTKSTLSRSEVTGGKKKPHRQKKTGRARQGSTNAPHQTHGGVAFAPKPRDYSKKVNKVTKNLALRSSISEKARNNDIIFLDKLVSKEAKTKEMAEMLNAFNIEKKTLVILDKNDISVRRALKNIPFVESCVANLTSVLQVVKANKIIMTSESAKKLEEVFSL